MANLVKRIRTDAGDLQVDYNALANKPTFINPNLLINSDFRQPINQRWKTTYSGGSANTTTNVLYTIDRWVKRNYGSTITVHDGYVRFKCDSEPTDDGTKTYAFVQPIEAPAVMLGGTYTLSAKIRSINGNHLFGMWQGEKAGFVSESITGDIWCKEISAPGVHSITLTLDSAFADGYSVLNVGFIQSDPQHVIGNYIDIEWVKLEYGNGATPFVPRLRGEEVNLCKRYYQYVNPYKVPFVILSSTTANGTIPFDIGLRTTPTVEISSCQYYDTKSDSNVNPATCVIDTSQTTNQCVVINITKNSASTFTEENVLSGTVRAFFDAEIY